jgi:hypothetical protein
MQRPPPGRTAVATRVLNRSAGTVRPVSRASAASQALSIELGVAAAAGQAYPDDQAFADSGVAAEQVIGVLAHPAQPPDRYSLPGQRGQSQIPELARERARAAVHVVEYRSMGDQFSLGIELTIRGIDG